MRTHTIAHNESRIRCNYEHRYQLIYLDSNYIVVQDEVDMYFNFKIDTILISV